MTSRREQIIASLTTALAGTTGVGSRIYRSRVEAFSRDEAPAIVIEPEAEDRRFYSNCKLDCTLDVVVAIYTRGAIPDQLADPIAVDVHAKLMADRTVSGLAMDLIPGPVRFERDKADLTSGWMINTYQVRYRTEADALDSV